MYIKCQYAYRYGIYRLKVGIVFYVEGVKISLKMINFCGCHIPADLASGPTLNVTGWMSLLSLNFNFLKQNFNFFSQVVRQ